MSQVLAILQRADVNIASMNVARSGKKVTTAAAAGAVDGGAAEVSMALCFMALDDDVPTTALSSLQSLSFLHDVAKIQLK
jgi:hypothetical protein